MNNVLYTRRIKRSQPDPEGCDFNFLRATEENNCYAVWYSAFETAATLVRWFPSKDEAIEWAVKATTAEISESL